jgi:hypothetical protein
MGTQRSFLIILACALGMGVAACGSSGSGTSSTSSPAANSPAPTSSAPAATGGSATQKAIATNWTTFFDPKTPVAKRISLLQDGQRFATVIKSQAGGGLAASASAKVTKVAVTSPTQANVTYNILLGGQPALSGKTGVAVKQGGTWKVGLASFCGLLALENGGKAPSACTSAG